MRCTLLISTLAATAFASPVAVSRIGTFAQSDNWQPAANTQATCDTKTDKYISSSQGTPMETFINRACAAMMPACAFPDHLAKDVVCTATVDFQLDGPKTYTQVANVVDGNGNSITDWSIKFDVTPAAQPEGSAGVFWQVADCYGYFDQILNKNSPDGCRTNAGLGAGTVKVGGDSSLGGTVFNVSLAPWKGSA